MTSTWIAIEERVVDGNVEIVRVRNEHGVQGLRVRPREGDLQSFDHYYGEVSNHPAIPILQRTPGEVIFADCTEPDGLDPMRVAIDALDAVRQQPKLKQLSVDAIRLGDDGRIRLMPRWEAAQPLDPLVAVGRFLQRIAVDHDDPRLERAIEAMLDPSPEIRQTARSVLQGEGPASRTGTVQYTVVAKERQSRGALDRARPKAAVIVAHRTLRELDAAKKSAAAGIAGLSTNALDGLIAAGLPLVLETHDRAQPARIAATRIAQQTGLPVTATTGASSLTLLGATALGTTSVVTGLSALSLAAVGLWTLPFLGGLLSLGLALFTAWSVWSFVQDRGQLALAIEAAGEAEEERARRSADPELARGWEALHDARSALGMADLPSAPASDLRGVLAAAERELDRCSKRSVTIRRGLANASSTEIQRRLAAIDDTDDAQVQRALNLTKTLQEVLALEDEQRALSEAAHQLESVLVELTSAIARWESSPDDQESMTRVIAATQRARARAHL